MKFVEHFSNVESFCIDFKIVLIAQSCNKLYFDVKFPNAFMSSVSIPLR